MDTKYIAIQYEVYGNIFIWKIKREDEYTYQAVFMGTIGMFSSTYNAYQNHCYTLIKRNYKAYTLKELYEN